MSAKKGEKKPYVLPSHVAFEAYLDSKRWESDTDGFIHEYCEVFKKLKTLGSDGFRAYAQRLLDRALIYFDELRAAGKDIPDMRTAPPCDRSKPKPKPKSAPAPMASRKKSKSPPPANNANVSPETLALIAAAEAAEVAEVAEVAEKTAKKTVLPLLPASAAKKSAPPATAAKKPAPPPPPSASASAVKKPGLHSPPPAAAAAVAAAPAPVLGAMPRAGAAVAAVPGVTPASCGRMTPEFVERWVADNYSHLPRGDPYGVRREEIHPIFNRDFEIKENAGGGTCLIHAFLTDLSPTYRAMTHAAKETVGAAFRKHIYAMLYPPDERMRIQEPDYLRFRTRPSIDAQVIERDPEEHVNDEFEDEIYDALARAYIRDTTGYLYDDDIQKLRDCFKVRIIIVTQNEDRDYDIFRLGPSSPEELAAEFATEQEANVENGYTRYIMIYQEGVHFEAVRRRGTDQYIFIYPEVQEILEASRGTATATRARLIELFAPGTPVVVRTGAGRVKRLVVAADGVRYAREFGGPVAPVEAVYLEPANHSTPPELYPIEQIISVNGVGFRISDYQPVEMAPSPEGHFASSASGSPEPNANNARFVRLTVIESPKRKGKAKGTTHRKSRSPSPAKSTHASTKRKSKSPSPPRPTLPPAANNSNNDASAIKAKAQAKLADAKAKAAAAASVLAQAKKNAISAAASAAAKKGK